MKINLNIIRNLLILITLHTVKAYSQSNVLDGPYLKQNSQERKVIPYTYLREADMMWSRRIWRKVDMREKINHVFYYPDQRIQ